MNKKPFQTQLWKPIKALNSKYPEKEKRWKDKQMQRVKVFQDEIKENDTLFLAVRLETKNANLILLSEGEDQLGTMAVAIPQGEKMLGPPTSSILLGDRNVIIARLLAERLAEKTGKLALTSVFVKTKVEKDVAPILIKLFDKTLKPKEEEKKE